MEEYQRSRAQDIRKEIQVSAVNHNGETVLPPRTFFLLCDRVDPQKGRRYITIEATHPEELSFLEQFAGKHNLENLSDRLYISLRQKGHKRPTIYSISSHHKNSQYPNEVTLSPINSSNSIDPPGVLGSLPRPQSNPHDRPQRTGKSMVYSQLPTISQLFGGEVVTFGPSNCLVRVGSLIRPMKTYRKKGKRYETLVHRTRHGGNRWMRRSVWGWSRG